MFVLVADHLLLQLLYGDLVGPPLFLQPLYFDLVLVYQELEGLVVILTLDIGVDVVLDGLGVGPEAQSGDGLFHLGLGGSHAQDDQGATVAPQGGPEYFGQGRVAVGDVLTLALAFELDHEGQEEQGGVDVFALLHPALDIVLLVEPGLFHRIELLVQLVALVMITDLLTARQIYEVQQGLRDHYSSVLHLLLGVVRVVVALLALLEQFQ